MSDQSVIAGQFAEAAELLAGQDRAIIQAALDGHSQLVLLGKLAHNTSGSDGIAGGAGHSGGAVENLIKVVAVFLGGEPGQSILNNSVIHASVTELLTQCGILSKGDTLVVNKNDGSSFLNLAGQSLHHCLLALQNLGDGHVFSPPKK